MVVSGWNLQRAHRNQVVVFGRAVRVIDFGRSAIARFGFVVIIVFRICGFPFPSHAVFIGIDDNPGFHVGSFVEIAMVGKGQRLGVVHGLFQAVVGGDQIAVRHYFHLHFVFPRIAQVGLGRESVFHAGSCLQFLADGFLDGGSFIHSQTEDERRNRFQTAVADRHGNLFLFQPATRCRADDFHNFHVHRRYEGEVAAVVPVFVLHGGGTDGKDVFHAGRKFEIVSDSLRPAGNPDGGRSRVGVGHSVVVHARLYQDRGRTAFNPVSVGHGSRRIFGQEVLEFRIIGIARRHVAVRGNHRPVRIGIGVQDYLVSSAGFPLPLHVQGDFSLRRVVGFPHVGQDQA